MSVHELTSMERTDGSFSMRRRNEDGSLLGASAIGGAIGGLALTAVLFWHNLPDIFNRETTLEIESGKATLVGVSTESPEVCTWKFDTLVEGAKAKLDIKNNLNVPDGIPFIGDDVNTTPGLWGSEEFNGVVENKVCTPAGIISADKDRKTGKYVLSFTSKEDGEIADQASDEQQIFTLTSYIDPHQINPGGKPLRISDSGAALASARATEWVNNHFPLLPESYAGATLSTYLEYAVDTQAYKDSAKCLPKAYEYAKEGVETNWKELWLKQAQALDPSLTIDHIEVDLPETLDPSKIENQYGPLGNFIKPDGATLKLTSAPPDLESCEDGVAINETPSGEGES